MMFHIKRYFGKLEKRQTDKIGTLKSPTKPLYLARKNVEELKNKKQELENLIPIKCKIEEEIKDKKEEIKKEEEMLKMLNEIESVSRMEKLEEERIQVYVEAKKESEQKKLQLEESLDEIKPAQKKGNISNLVYNIPGILFVISAILIFLLDTKIIGILGAIVSVISFLVILITNLRANREFKQRQETINMQKREIENKIEIIQSEIDSKEKLIKENKEGLVLRTKMQKEQIMAKYPNVGKGILEDEINIEKEQNYINNLKLSVNQKEIEARQITEILEELVEVEEKLNINEEQYKQLIEYNEIIEIAKSALEKAYVIMKESITPKFTENLSNSIEKITSGKYKKIKVNDEDGLALETTNRKLCYSKLFKSRYN